MLFSPIYYLFFISLMTLLTNLVFYWCQQHNPVYWLEKTCFSFHSWLKASTSILWRNFNILFHKIILSFTSLPFFPQTLPTPFPLGFFLFIWLLGGDLEKVLYELYVSHKYYATEITTALSKLSNPSSHQCTTFCLLYKPWHSIITNLERIELL